jgi:hypothetical protein
MQTPIKPAVEKSLIPNVDRSSYIAYKILYFGYIAFPILVGLDKYFNYLVNWPIYLTPLISKVIYPTVYMQTVGVFEIIAGIIVAVKPRNGAYIVAIWLVCKILNLLSIPGYYDIALRDFGLFLGAMALSFLAKEYDVE